VLDVGAGELTLGPGRVKDFAELLDERLAITLFVNLGQVNECLNRFTLAEVKAERLGANQMVLLEPIGEEALGHGRGTGITFATPVVHGLSESINEEHLAGAAAFHDFILVRGARLFPKI